VHEEVAFRVMPRDYPAVVGCCAFGEFAFGYSILCFGVLVYVVFDFLRLHADVC